MVQSDSSLLVNPQGNCQSRILTSMGPWIYHFNVTTISAIYTYFPTTYPCIYSNKVN